MEDPEFGPFGFRTREGILSPSLPESTPDEMMAEPVVLFKTCSGGHAQDYIADMAAIRAALARPFGGSPHLLRRTGWNHSKTSKLLFSMSLVFAWTSCAYTRHCRQLAQIRCRLFKDITSNFEVNRSRVICAGMAGWILFSDSRICFRVGSYQISNHR